MGNDSRTDEKTGVMTRSAPSRHPGMGANLYDGGVAFRVWAPFANEVFVTGSFNDWNRESHPLAHEENGYWSTDVDGAKAGHEYKFIIVNGGQTLERNDPYARVLTNSVGNGIVHDPAFDWEGDGFQMAPWNELVIYELHVGTFNDENPYGPGNIESSIERLPYLRGLGINAVEVMPLAEFAGDFSWGYNPAYIFAVESAYGGPNAFKRFVREAHKHGIAVILDVVYNHFGPSDLGVWQFDGWKENDESGGIYFYNDHRADTPWGRTRPDYGRPEVRRYIRDNVMMWLEDYHLDGLRWDGTVFIRYKSFFKEPGTELPDGVSLMREINREVQERMPGKLMIAEDLQGDVPITQPLDQGGLGFGAQWDARFVHPMRSAIIPPRDEERSMEAVRNALLHRYDLDAFRRVIYTESHDEVANGCARVAHEINPTNAKSWESQKRSTLGAGLVLTAPGIPMLFQGQEFLEDEWFCDTDPVDWHRLEEHAGVYHLYRDLIALRRNLRGTTRGLSGQHADVTHVHPELKLLVLQRWKDDGPLDRTVVVANLSHRGHEGYRIGFPAPGLWKVRLNSDAKLYSDDFGGHPSYDVEAVQETYDGQPAAGAISIGPYTVLIYSQDAPA